jgi:hypothetical protein
MMNQLPISIRQSLDRAMVNLINNKAEASDIVRILSELHFCCGWLWQAGEP